MAETEKESREELKKKQKARASKYGIQPKDGGHLTPPKDYPSDPDQYADPVNFRYPIDEEHIRAAIAYFNQTEHRTQGGYSWAEWAIMGKRIARAATRLLGAKYVYRAGKVVRADEKKEMTDKDAGDAQPLGDWAYVKMLTDPDEDGVVRVGHYAVLWGDEERKDLVGEFFTRDTQELTKVFDGLGKLPLLYRHGGEKGLGAEVVGVVDFMAADDVGLWYEAQLKDHVKYRKAIIALLRARALGTSTGALPRTRDVAKDGRITRWAIAEVSLTPTPMEPRMIDEVPPEVLKDIYTSAGLPAPGDEAWKDIMVDGDTPVPEDARGASEQDAHTDTLSTSKETETLQEHLALLKLIADAA